ncbi:MAG TPA: RecX family transcriptional regulator [Candidatus Cybelea sp.]|nr:RecX family transcriptional regulator [Candidatus Cybelea sp.]
MPNRRKPRKLKPADLHEAALDHLARYAVSAARLKQVLMRRIARSAKAHALDPEPLLDELARVIERLTQSGLIDDARFAEMKARGLHRRGGSRRQIAAKLGAAGVAAPQAHAALAQIAEESENSELAAALAYAKRRRLGSFRTPADASPERFRKDLAAMARAGFALDLARQALAGSD